MSSFLCPPSSKLATVYKIHRLAVRAPYPGACGNLGISTRARQPQGLLTLEEILTTKDKGEAGEGRNGLGREETRTLALKGQSGLPADP